MLANCYGRGAYIVVKVIIGPPTCCPRVQKWQAVLRLGHKAVLLLLTVRGKFKPNLVLRLTLCEFADREKTGQNVMRDKNTIRRLRMYRLGGKVTRYAWVVAKMSYFYFSAFSGTEKVMW